MKPNIIPISVFGVVLFAAGNGDAGWGSLVNSFSMKETGALVTAICTYDGYFISTRGYQTAPINNGFYVYTATGSFVRSVPFGPSFRYSINDGTGKCHLGHGYFATLCSGVGLVVWPYSAGGRPGTNYQQINGSLQGRGLSWDGTYYYCTTQYGNHIQVYTSTGSFVRRIPESWPYWRYLRGHGTPVSGNGYLYANDTLFNPPAPFIREISVITGSCTRSFRIPEGDYWAGLDLSWGGGYLYSILDNYGPGLTVYIYDGDYLTNILPGSVGKIKAIYR